MKIDGLTDAELAEALRAAEQASGQGEWGGHTGGAKGGTRAMLARALLAVHAELARRPALPPGVVDLNAHPMAEVLRKIVAAVDQFGAHRPADTFGVGALLGEIAAEANAARSGHIDAGGALVRVASLALLGLIRNGGSS